MWLAEEKPNSNTYFGKSLTVLNEMITKNITFSISSNLNKYSNKYILILIFE